ncbi:Premnaspirodiene oxygenase [Apostasia shenzhenica]|uniref:Premnaspirodiene oxygenase n=1 Tax=Apostasia shenzhenica TaxID=1088818 RepID=A0A2I0B5L5_9ASPA|nr:Premnaspirodiene oxygenase [Apostasia shenzhenica]
MPFTRNSLIFGSFFLLLLLPLRHLLLLVRRFMENESSQRAKLPPGPWKLPILGSIHHLPGEQTHRRFHSLAVKYGPLFHLKLGQVDFIVASSPEFAEQVLGTHDKLLASRPTLVAVKAIGYDSSGIGFSPYGAYWRQLRKICTQELLSCKRVASFGFIREEEGERLVQEIREAAAGVSPVNLTEMLMSLTNRQITRAAFGKECASRQRFLSALKKTMKLLPLLRVADLFPSLSSLICMMDGSLLEMRRIRREMDGVLDEIIREHRAKRGRDHHDQLMQEDLVDVLLRILERGDLQIPLTIDNVKAVILTGGKSGISRAMPFTGNSLIFGSFFLLLLLPLRHLLLLVRRFMENESSQRAKLPPGPWKLPILGSIHHLPGEQTHRRFHSLALKYGPLFHLKLGQVDFVVASSPESAEQVLGTHDQLLASRPTLVAVKAIGYDSSGIGFSPYGAYWRQLRKICTQELLSCKRVASFGFIREEEGERLVQEIREAAAGGSPVNLTEMLMSLTNRQITRAAFGKECASRQRFLSALKKTMKLLSLLRVADLFPSLSSLICMMDGSLLEMRRLRREMDGVLDEIIREHRAKRGRLLAQNPQQKRPPNPPALTDHDDHVLSSLDVLELSHQNAVHFPAKLLNLE